MHSCRGKLCSSPLLVLLSEALNLKCILSLVESPLQNVPTGECANPLKQLLNEPRRKSKQRLVVPSASLVIFSECRFLHPFCPTPLVPHNDEAATVSNRDSQDNF